MVNRRIYTLVAGWEVGLGRGPGSPREASVGLHIVPLSVLRGLRRPHALRVLVNSLSRSVLVCFLNYIRIAPSDY